jgi:hypothetical protein
VTYGNDDAALRDDGDVGTDALFCQLDAQQIWYSKRVWQVRVDSITRIGDDRWLQVRLSGPFVIDVIIRAGADAEGSDVLTALRWWLNDLVPLGHQRSVHAVRAGAGGNVLWPQAADFPRRGSGRWR